METKAEEIDEHIEYAIKDELTKSNDLKSGCLCLINWFVFAVTCDVKVGDWMLTMWINRCEDFTESFVPASERVVSTTSAPQVRVRPQTEPEVRGEGNETGSNRKAGRKDGGETGRGWDGSGS